MNPDTTDADGWDGPYEATIAGDKTTSDGCSAGVNLNKAFERYDIGQEIEIRAVSGEGQSAIWEETVKAKSNGLCYYSTIPIAIRKQLGLSKGDDYTFWLRGAGSDDVRIDTIAQITVKEDTAENIVKWLNQYSEYCEVHDDNQAERVRSVSEKFANELNAGE